MTYGNPFAPDEACGMAAADAIRRLRAAGYEPRVASDDGRAGDVRPPAPGVVRLDLERGKVIRVRKGLPSSAR